MGKLHSLAVPRPWCVRPSKHCFILDHALSWQRERSVVELSVVNLDLYRARTYVPQVGPSSSVGCILAVSNLFYGELPYLGFDFPSYQLNGNILHLHTVSPTTYESEFCVLYLTNHSSCPLDSPPALTLRPIPGGMVRDNLTLAACQCLCRCHRTETKNKECRPTCFPRPIQCCMAY